MGREGEWLIRGDPKVKRISSCEPMLPQSGRDGTWGVFLADNLKQLMYPIPGVFWVVAVGELSRNWLYKPSNLYDEWINFFASSHRLNLRLYGGYVEAERMVHQSFDVYDTRSGIATLNNALTVQDCNLAVVHDGKNMTVWRRG